MKRIAAALLTLGLLAGCGEGSVPLGFTPTPAPIVEDVDAFVEKCGYAEGPGWEILDDGRAIEIRTKGKESFGISIKALDCMLDELGVPESIQKSMGSTRALDGKQRDTWPGHAAEWSFHPDSGLNLIVKLKQDD